MNKIEIFIAGCPLCKETIERIQQQVCESCEVIVHDLHDPLIAEHAQKFGVKRAPAVVVNGTLSPCCKSCQNIDIAV